MATTCYTKPTKRARYMSQWESSLYHQETTTTSLSLDRLFDARRWHTTAAAAATTALKKKHQHETKKDQAASKTLFFFRLEHRVGGALATRQGEERILLFRSDHPGAIAKIIYSSTQLLLMDEDEHDDTTTTNSNDRQQQQQDDSHSSKPVAQAYIHSLNVKDCYRGYDFGESFFFFSLIVIATPPTYLAHSPSSSLQADCCFPKPLSR